MLKLLIFIAIISALITALYITANLPIIQLQQNNPTTAASSFSESTSLSESGDISPPSHGTQTPESDIFSENYAYQQLNSSEKELYAQIYNALISHTTLITEGLSSFDAEQIYKINRYVLIDFPEIFWARENGTAWIRRLMGNGTVFKYEFNYIMTKEEREFYQKQIDGKVREILRDAPELVSDYDKLLYVYEYIIHNTDYDSAAAEKIKAGLSTDTGIFNFDSFSVCGVFINGKAVCDGYSRATQYLLKSMGVFCTYVSGVGKGQNHSWNLVRLDGEYYYVDTTWGDPLIGNAQNISNLSYDYFCITTAELQKTHTADNTVSLPECTAVKYNYFVYNSLLLDSYDLQQITAIIARAAAGKKESAIVKFSSYEAAADAYKALFQNNDIFSALAEAAASVNTGLIKDSTTYSRNEDQNTITLYLVYS